ncbi:unnamed protein product [Debaryomyces tyrocola]|nr:unnamed protein product [Debaryomyces tyrocola]
MKLAEALRLRKDYETNLQQLESRILYNCKVQEGDVPSEDPEELIELYLQMSDKLKKLVSNINLTNSELMFKFGKCTTPKSMTSALAERGELKRQAAAILRFARSGVINMDMYSRKEIKYISTISVKKYRSMADDISRDLRYLDINIQEQNWLGELIEDI